MSVHRLVFISCDACEEVMEHASNPGFTAAEARQTVRRECAAHVNLSRGRDLCGACWDQGYRVICGRVVDSTQGPKGKTR